MKLLLVSVLLVCFLSKASCIECFECTERNILDDCKQTEITTCGPETSQKYCLIADYERVDEDELRYCNKNCTYKGCIEKEYEKFCESGTFNISQAISDWKGTVYCCEGNLCNSANKLYNKKNNDKTLRNQTIVSTTSVSILSSRFLGITNSTTLVSLLKSRSSGTIIYKKKLYFT